MTKTRFNGTPLRTTGGPSLLPAIVIAFSLVAASESQLRAQPQNESRPIGGQRYQNGQAVRKTAESILSRPEFKHFRRLKGERGYRGPFELPINGGFGGNDRPGRNPDGGNQDQPNPGQIDDQGPNDGPGQGNNQPLLDDAQIPPAQDDVRQNDAGNDFIPDWGENDGDWDNGNGDAIAEAGGEGASTAGEAISGLYTVFAVLMLILIVSLIVYVVIKSWAGSEQTLDATTAVPTDRIEGDIEPETAPGELPADVYISAAQELANKGQYREAIAQLLLGAMSNIERSGMVRFRRGLTHRDYMRAVRPNETIYPALRSMVRLYEPLGFGRRPATSKHFDLSLSGYESGFHGTTPVVNV